MSEAPSEDEEDKGALPSLLESKMALMIVGFVLTTVLGGLLNSWIQGEQWEKETQFKVFQNQLADGDKVQTDVLGQIGDLRRHLNTARSKAVNAYFWYKKEEAPVDEGTPYRERKPIKSVQNARDYFENELTPAYLDLAYSIHRTRNKVALIFGKKAARALLNRDDNILHFDMCSVLMRDGDKNGNQDCLKRRMTEKGALGSRKGFRKPESIFHAVRVSQFLIKRMIWCMDPRETYKDKKTKCEDLETLRTIMNRRNNLVGTAYDELSDQIFAEMLKLNAAVK